MYIDVLFSYGSQFSQDRQKVIDSIHDLFLNLYKYRKNLAATDNVKYYLFRSLKNQILNQPKSKTIFYDNQFFDGIDSPNITASYEEEFVETEFLEERTSKLSEALSSLSKKQKQCIFLRFNENRQYEEIAEIMNVSVQTSRTTIYRAIKQLRANLTIILFWMLNFL